MKLTQHIIAGLSALLLLIGSFLQSRRSLARAEEKATGTDHPLHYFKYSKWWPLLLRGKIPTANAERARDAKHLVHVARLWELILFGSFLALGAEVIDLVVD